ncbi:MAG: CoB--CoM heterodisulfide reductase iron-sulfur subunit B family protein [Desulfobacterales bacterium]
MKYLYYPGCSLESTARQYDVSTRSLMAALGAELTEIPEWSCCGASAANAVDRALATALPALNLAAAEAAMPGGDILVPCSACYLNLKKVHAMAQDDPGGLAETNEIISAQSLHYSGNARPRHLLDILSRDFGPAEIGQRVTDGLSGMLVAPYYGCQCLRPYRVFDDPETPHSMDALLQAAGARVYRWSMASRCCGASHMTTHPDTGQELVYKILKAARGADIIAAVCPMCLMNLEAYQKKISSRFGEDVRKPVAYLPELLCRAMDMQNA